jgi:hypothetical protein
MQCFCSHLEQETDKETAKAKTFEITFFTENEDGNMEGTTQEVQMCAAYFSDKLWSKILGTSIGFIIIAVNIVLKTLIIKLITWIGEDTVSE